MVSAMRRKGGIMKRMVFFLLLLVLSCANNQLKTSFGPSGATIHHDNIIIMIPEDAVSESVTIQIERSASAEITFPEGTRRLAFGVSILPDTLVLKKPMRISIPAKGERIRLAARIKDSYLPIADSWFEHETLHAQISHGGKYALIETPPRYGILNTAKADHALLVVPDLHTGAYLEKFRTFMSKEGYEYPLWTFIYPADHSIEENAQLLARELTGLHEKYGSFRMDVVGFGTGGIIAARYGADTTLYQHDISSAFVTVGTPFWGSELADFKTALQAKTPYRFYFTDGMGENSKEMQPHSHIAAWLKEHRGMLCWHYYDRFDENKNFASLRGKARFAGNLPEETDGDGLVSLSSSMLSFLEPEPFPLDHFDLMEDGTVYKATYQLLQLFRSFNWPKIFTSVWTEEEPFSLINETWKQEVMLHYRSPLNVQLLLDFNENMLHSVPENGVLITNGDNDTYPAWFLQAQGVRSDVLIANFSLLNIPNYILFLKKRGLPIDLTEEEIRSLRPEKTEGGKLIYVADTIVSLLMKNGKRPVVFAATVAPQRMEAYELGMRGMVFEVSKDRVDIETTSTLFHDAFNLAATIAAPRDSINSVIEKMLMNYHAAIFKLVDALMEQERPEEALEELLFIESFPTPEALTGHLYTKEAEIRYGLQQPEKADKVLEELLDKEWRSAIIKAVATTFYENGRKEKAIALLAEWLEEHPDDREVLNQLSDYGKEE